MTKTKRKRLQHLLRVIVGGYGYNCNAPLKSLAALVGMTYQSTSLYLQLAETSGLLTIDRQRCRRNNWRYQLQSDKVTEFLAK